MGEDAREPRTRDMLIWRPEVHRHFGESLYYFLIGFRTYSSATLQNLQRTLTDKLGLPGFCLYSIFGYYDCLLRIWLNPRAAERCRQELSNLKDVEIAPDFVTGGANAEHDHWAFRSDSRSREDIERAIDKHSPNEYRLAQEERGTAFEAMREDKLLAERKTWFPREIKFYISVCEVLPMAATHRGKVLEDIWKAVRHFEEETRGGDALHNSSVYVGRGFAFALVKGVLPTVPSLMDFAEYLRLSLAGYHVNTATFIVGGVVGEETDYIQPGSLGQEYVMNANVQGWIPELYAPDAPGKTPLAKERLSLVVAYLERNDFFHYLDLHLRPWFGQLVVALVRESVSETTGAPVASDMLSSWFRDIEGWYRKNFDDYLAALAQGDTRRQAKLSRDAGVVKEIDRASFGDLLRWIPKVAEVARGGETVDSFCSPADLEIANKAANLRNDVAHNRTEYLSHWQSTLDLVAKFTRVASIFRVEMEETIASFKGRQAPCTGTDFVAERE